MNDATDRITAPSLHKLPAACGAHVMARALKRHGVEVMFGQSLPSALYLVAPEFGIRQIAYRTENAGGSMADGYARTTNKVGVVTAQNGPAAALLVSPLSEALKASVPIVAIVQDVRRTQTDKNAFQELDHFGIFAGCAKWVRRVSHASRIDDYVDMAFTAAASGRPGPAVLMVPQDVLLEPMQIDASVVQRAASLGTYPLDRCVPDPARIDEAARLLARAKSPLVVAGGGVHSSQAQDALAHLQERAGLPVATTVMGKGAVDERHPLSVGVIGYFMGTRAMAKHMRPLVERSDVILFVGARTNQNGTDSWTVFPKDARYIHIDIDGQEVGRNYEALRLVGDAKLTLAALASALAKHASATPRDRATLEQTIARARAAHENEAAENVRSDAVPIRPERVIRELGALLTAESLVVCDASYSPIWAANYLRSQRPGQRFLAGRGSRGPRMGLAGGAGR